ncbi:MAG: MerR family transcriptional regulator [Muribaculaceae bacterium]|nr:MerR family transcriptional regulator [Muribaculaceae bacterium]
MDELDKEYYKISDVAEMLGVTMATLRFWEKEFPEAAPIRTATRTRYYTPATIRTLRIIYFLVRVKGLRLEAAREQLRVNRENVSRRMDVIDELQSLRSELKEMLSALGKRK